MRPGYLECRCSECELDGSTGGVDRPSLLVQDEGCGLRGELGPAGRVEDEAEHRSLDSGEEIVLTFLRV